MQAQQKEKDLSWLREAIGNGLMRMYSLRLKGAPAEDMIDVVAEVWLDAVMDLNKDWQESLDYPRIEKAFTRLIQLYGEWPAPKMLIEELPPRKLPKLLQPAPLSHEESVEILKMLKVNKDLVGSKIAQRKIQEEKERAERHQRWVEHIEQKKRDFAAMAKIMTEGKPNG
jgi:hypothetical protein